ncbi:MAG: TlpA family protein disulfide reductase [Gemmataceae bacterium]|nr:TlpA family protein disulfide reductase [Gemmataceae bacterium]
MSRLRWAVLAVGLLWMPTLVADEQPSDKKPASGVKDRAAQWGEIRMEFQKALPEVIREWRTAGSEAEKKKALARLDPISDKAYAFVEEKPGDELSLEALVFLLGTRPQPPERAVALITEHHLNSDRLATALPTLMQYDTPSVQTLLRKAMEESKSQTVRGVAMFSYAKMQHSKAEMRPDGEQSKTLTTEAERVLDRVSREFGDVKLGRQTLKEQADKLLFVIRNLSIGKSAPEVVSRDLEDNEVRLSSLRGKVVVLDIWATWCGPCRAMIPHEREMVQKLKDKPFVLVSISADEKKETLKEFLENEPMPWVHWWEGRREGGILNDWNVEFFPTIYILDHKGVIRYKNIRGKAMEEAVEKLLAEMDQGKDAGR